MVKEVLEVGMKEAKQDFCFKLIVKSEFLMDKTFLFYSETRESKDTWVRRIRNAAKELQAMACPV
jgi:hypothetical protein